MNRSKWESLAAWFNEAEITPAGSAVSDPAIPGALFDYYALYGIEYDLAAQKWVFFNATTIGQD